MKKDVQVTKWQPYCIVTNRNKAVKMDVLGQFQTSQSKQLSKDTFSNTDYERDGLVKPLYTPLTMAKLLEINTYHMRACKTKAEDIAGNGWELYPNSESPNESQRERVQEFFAKQREPIEKTIKKLQLDKEAVGYFAMEVAREGNRFDGPVDLIGHIPAHTIRVHKSGNKYCQFRDNKRVWFRDFGYNQDIECDTGHEAKPGSLTSEKRGNEVIWSVNYTPRSSFYGVPDVTPAIGAILGDISRRDYNISFFSNYGVPAYIVYVTGDFDPGDIDPETGKTPLVSQIEEKFQEVVKNPQSVMILTLPSEPGSDARVEIKIEPLSTEVKEASFRMYRNDNRDEVIAAHGMPPYRMGIYETGQLAGNLGKEATVIYYTSIIKPKQEEFNEIMNFYILPTLEITDWTFELKSIDIEDIERDVNQSISLLQNGVMTPNQVISFLGSYFGIKKDEDNEALNYHYINGQPIDAGGFLPASQVTAALESIKNKLIEVIVDDVTKRSRGSSDRDRRFTQIVKDLQRDKQRRESSLQRTADINS